MSRKCLQRVLDIHVYFKAIAEVEISTELTA